MNESRNLESRPRNTVASEISLQGKIVALLRGRLEVRVRRSTLGVMANFRVSFSGVQFGHMV